MAKRCAGQKSVWKKSAYALFFAFTGLLLIPGQVQACGGIFPITQTISQDVQRIIFAVKPGQVTLYEQIGYEGEASDFAWVLPVPVVPKVETALSTLFGYLDSYTSPRFIPPQPPPCGLQPLDSGNKSGAPPTGGAGVNVYSSGTVGPFAYDVVDSKEASAITNWLQGHQYKVPSSMSEMIDPYVKGKMLFLAMRLKPKANIHDIAPLKITMKTSMEKVMVPIRMSMSSSKPRLNMLIWIFGTKRYVPENYKSFTLNNEQLSVDPYPGANYQQLVDREVEKDSGQAFITEYAQPTKELSSYGLDTLSQEYSYVTRLYTRLKPENMSVDPMFVPGGGGGNVNRYYNLSQKSLPASCDGLNLFLGSLGVLAYPLSGAACCIGVALPAFLVGRWLGRRRRRSV